MPGLKWKERELLTAIVTTSALSHALQTLLPRSAHAILVVTPNPTHDRPSTRPPEPQLEAYTGRPIVLMISLSRYVLTLRRCSLFLGSGYCVLLEVILAVLAFYGFAPSIDGLVSASLVLRLVVLLMLLQDDSPPGRSS